jgi:opacity protein-like surface antigen
MTRVGVIGAGLAAALAFTASAAQAADPPGSWRKPPLEEMLPSSPYRELASGWYLRADLGYRWYAGSSSVTNATDATYSDGFAGTIGFGWKHRWFRADFTYDRGTPTRVAIATTSAVNQPQIGAKIRPETVLVNGYLDLGSWGGFTPYVGAGAGVSRLMSSIYTDTALTPPLSGDLLAGKSSAQNFAWAAMGGVAFQLSPRWMVDVGYRYMSLGDLPSTDLTESSGGSVSPFFRNITAQEVRIGVRLLLD